MLEEVMKFFLASRTWGEFEYSVLWQSPLHQGWNISLFEAQVNEPIFILVSKRFKIKKGVPVGYL